MFRKKRILTLMETLTQSRICFDVEPGHTLLRALREAGYLSVNHSGTFTVGVNNDFTDSLVKKDDLVIASAYMDEGHLNNLGHWWSILVCTNLKSDYFDFEFNCSSFHNLNEKLIDV